MYIYKVSFVLQAKRLFKFYQAEAAVCAAHVRLGSSGNPSPTRYCDVTAANVYADRSNEAECTSLSSTASEMGLWTAGGSGKWFYTPAVYVGGECEALADPSCGPTGPPCSDPAVETIDCTQSAPTWDVATKQWSNVGMPNSPDQQGGFDCITHTRYTDLNCAPGTESAVYNVPNGACMPESEDMQTFGKYECDTSLGGLRTSYFTNSDCTEPMDPASMTAAQTIESQYVSPAGVCTRSPGDGGKSFLSEAAVNICNQPCSDSAPTKLKTVDSFTCEVGSSYKIILKF